MKKEMALKSFVKQYYNLLRGKPSFDKQQYEVAKKAYFGDKLKYKFGIPKDKEICDELVATMVVVQKISNKEALQQIIEDTPLLKMNN